MFRKIDDFVESYVHTHQGTQKLLDALTDESLDQRVAPEHRSIRNVAWHLVTTLPEMMGRTGLSLAGPAHDQPAPASAKEIAEAYKTAAASLLGQVKEHWNDETLLTKDDMYGEQWARGQTLSALIAHEVHHRGQLTVLMRQAGLVVPGVYGPAKEEWAAMGMAAPAE
jgi:uncharacterized damage-inducible protein DinB